MKHTMNRKQHHEGRVRDEGHHAKHMREDGGVPIVGPKGRSIHGSHSGERAMHATGAVTGSPDLDTGMYHKKPGKPGEHEEEA